MLPFLTTHRLHYCTRRMGTVSLTANLYNYRTASPGRDVFYILGLLQTGAQMLADEQMEPRAWQGSSQSGPLIWERKLGAESYTSVAIRSHATKRTLRGGKWVTDQGKKR